MSNTIELFNFNAEHNGVTCIESLKSEDKGTESQFWFTSKMLCDVFDVADRTLRDNLKSLMDEGEIHDCGNSQSYLAPDSSGVLRIKTTIYNLEVLNKLGMCCFRGNKKAKEIRNAFNDVLVKHETDSYSVRHIDSYMIDDRVERAKAWIAEQVETRKIISGLEENLKIVSTERDKALVEKRRINEKRIASACATAAKYAIKCQKLEKEIKELIGQKTFPFCDGNLKLV